MVEIKGLAAFCKRAVAHEVGDDGEIQATYVRIRTGTTRSRATVAASKIRAAGRPAPELEAELRGRLEGLELDAGERAWVELLEQGTSEVIDQASSAAAEAEAAIGRPGAELAAMASSLVRMAEAADRRADVSLDRALDFAGQLVEAKVERAQLGAFIEAQEMMGGENGAMDRAVKLLEPIMPIVAARMMAGASKDGQASQGQASEPTEPGPLADHLVGQLQASAARLVELASKHPELVTPERGAQVMAAVSVLGQLGTIAAGAAS